MSSASTFLSLVGFSVSNDLLRHDAVDEKRMLKLSRLIMLVIGIITLVVAFFSPVDIFWLTYFVSTLFASSWGAVALELSRTEGPRGNYLAHEHTAKYCRRESWNSRYFGAHYPTASGDLYDEDLVERIDRELQEILLNHQPEALAQETIRKMQSIAEKFRQRYVDTEF